MGVKVVAVGVKVVDVGVAAGCGSRKGCGSPTTFRNGCGCGCGCHTRGVVAVEEWLCVWALVWVSNHEMVWRL